ncbi:MAG TPA: hypothetical protein VF914_21040 [Chloroflexia bacterium]|jgi:hypothetical protein
MLAFIFKKSVAELKATMPEYEFNEWPSFLKVKKKFDAEEAKAAKNT